jgi:small-conductance mechanosensitive channel
MAHKPRSAFSKFVGVALYVAILVVMLFLLYIALNQRHLFQFSTIAASLGFLGLAGWVTSSSLA